MKVQYKDEIFGNFKYKEGDYITIVLRFLTVKEGEEELYYHGTVKKIDGTNGIWCVLDDDKTKEVYFPFADIESVFSGDRIPFFAGSIERPNFNRDTGTGENKQTLTIELEGNLLTKLHQIATIKGVSLEEATTFVLEQYIDKYTKLEDSAKGL